MRKYIKSFIIPAVLISVMLIYSGCQDNIEANTSTDNTSDIISEITTTSETSSTEMPDSSIPEDSKEITDKKTILKFIEYCKTYKYVKNDSYISMRFFDFNSDGEIEMMLGHSMGGDNKVYEIFKYYTSNNVVIRVYKDVAYYQIPVYSESMPFLKCSR